MSTIENEEPTTQRPMTNISREEPTVAQQPSTPVQTQQAENAPPPEISSPAADDLEQSAPTSVQPKPSVEQPETFQDNSEQQATSSTIEVPFEQGNPATSGQNAAVPSLTSLPVLPYMDIDDLPALKIASDPQISPDGGLIAFTLFHCDDQQNTTGSTIWLVSSTGSKSEAPRQITSGKYHDFMPRWSPDGQTLAFLSDRTGSAQLYLLPMHGGEPRQLSTLAQGITEYSWHPGGQMILAHSAWKPQDDQTSTTAGEQTVSIYTRLDAHWDGHGYKQCRHQQLWLLPLEGQSRRLTSEPVDLVQSCWSPDGQELVFCANRRPDPDLSVSMALWVLTLASGQMRRLTPEEGLAQVPSWSPDGKTIAYLYSADQTEAGNISPWIVDPRGSTPPHLATTGAENLTCQTWIIDELRDEYIAPPQWYPDSQALLVPVQEKGQAHLYRLDVTSNTLQRLTSGNGRYLSPQLSKNGQIIAMVRADWFTPGDIWSMDSTGKQPHKLTRVNDALLQSHQLVRPKRVTWQSFDGKEIEGLLYLPALPEQGKAPLIVAPHGGPSLAWGDGYVHEFQVMAGRGYAVLAPNPRGSAGYGEDFCRLALNDWGGADFKDIMAGIDYVCQTEPIDEQRLGITGISYGGYMTNWAITQTRRFKAAVSRNGISAITTAALLSDQSIWFNLSMPDENLRQERSALYQAANITTPLLLLHAENDLRCPSSESLQLFTALRKRKHIVELVRYPQCSHLMDWPTVGTPQQRSDRLRKTVQWFERFV